MESFVAILTNIVILFGLISIISLIQISPEKSKFWTKIGTGIIIGLTTILLMSNSWEMSSGIIFDSRTIILSLTAVYFNPLVSIIATIIALIFRIQLGGDGMVAGSLTIIVSFVVGYVYRRYFKKQQQTSILSLYLFGVVVHILMLVCQLAIPYPKNIDVLKSITVIVLVFYPLATLLLGKSIEIYEQRSMFQNIIQSSEKKYREVFENNKIGIIQFDNNGVIELVNDTFAHILRVPKDKIVGLEMLKLPNQGIVHALHKALEGKTETYEGLYESVLSGHQFPTRVQFSPLLEEKQVTGGIAIVEDLSKEHEINEKIYELTHYDPQTKLLNRSSFDRYLTKHADEVGQDISLAVFDINTLHIINTTFGYEIGNDIIRLIGNVLLTETIEKPDFTPYRIGGDEFALIMVHTNEERAHRFTTCIEDKINSIENNKFDISVTSGVYTTSKSDENLQNAFSKVIDIVGANKIYAKSSISAKTVDVIMATLFAKNKREQLHSERVSIIAQSIAEAFHLGTAFTNRVALAGKLHDIGKITMDTTILDKPDKLTDDEQKIMESHSLSGFRILSVVQEYVDVANIVYAHHEKMDGSGYPRGLVGHNIPLESRIIAVADAYDAMIEERPYKQARTIEEAMAELRRCENTQFDPEVVAKFIQINSSN